MTNARDKAVMAAGQARREAGPPDEVESYLETKGGEDDLNDSADSLVGGQSAWGITSDQFMERVSHLIASRFENCNNWALEQLLCRVADRGNRDSQSYRLLRQFLCDSVPEDGLPERCALHDLAKEILIPAMEHGPEVDDDGY